MSNRFQRRLEKAKQRAAHGKVVMGKVADIGQREAAIEEKKKSLAAMIDEIAASEMLVEDKLDHVMDLFAEAVHEAQSMKDTPVEALRAAVHGFESGKDEGLSRKEAADALTNEMDAHFSRFREAFVRTAWCGCTEETVDQIVAEEVIARVMLREDVALGLSCCDRIALECERARKEGRDIIETAHETYRRTLGAEKARDIRERLIAASWENATEDSLEDKLCTSVVEGLDHWTALAWAYGILEESAKGPESEAGFMRRWEPVYRDAAKRRKINLSVKNACIQVLSADKWCEATTACRSSGSVGWAERRYG
jgi:hypothetical protein